MAARERDHYELAEEVETKLGATLEDQDFNPSRIDPLLHEYRTLYEDLIQKNCEDALRTPIEDKLWDAHVRINGRFRKQLGYVRKKKPVEQRKASASYLRFLKSSQRFYRGYIQKLATHAHGIGGLTAIARNLGVSGAVATPEEDTQTSPELQHAILKSCHKTLIHLGDLSRYRESELDAKVRKKNWGPAIGYYDLAIAINPLSGTPHNQLAIIARIEGNSFRTLYHLYRAQSAYESPPTANDNLALELQKLHESLQPADFDVDCSDATASLSKHIQRCFPLLHSCCFGATALQEHIETEDQVLGYFDEGLEKCTLSTECVNMIVLCNIAADFVAGDRWQADPEEARNEHVFKLIQRLNIRTFSCLLRMLQNDAQEASKLETVTSTVRTLLPSLRYYSAWLISRADLLSFHLGDSTMSCVVKDFWAIYAKTMSLLLPANEVNDLPQLEYLLEEDVDIIGFRPLQEAQLQRKPSVAEALAKRINHGDLGAAPVKPDVEMRCRIRDILDDTRELSKNDCVPIKYLTEAKRFTVVGDWIDSSQASGPSTAPSNRSQNHGEDLTTDGTVSQEASNPSMQSTKASQEADDSVAHKSSNEMPPPPSRKDPSDPPSTQSNTTNGTSFSAGSTTLHALKKTFRQTQQQATDHDSTSPEHDNTSTQPHVDLTSSTSSGASSEMPDPTQASRKTKLHRLHPKQIKEPLDRKRFFGGTPDDSEIRSSNVSPDSSRYIRRKIESTPPNGQG
ncbi:MAG: hypothetical protein Q9168_002942 [Polycauliona sp. 1 TL-2023]